MSPAACQKILTQKHPGRRWVKWPVIKISPITINQFHIIHTVKMFSLILRKCPFCGDYPYSARLTLNGGWGSGSGIIWPNPDMYMKIMTNPEQYFKLFLTVGWRFFSRSRIQLRVNSARTRNLGCIKAPFCCPVCSPNSWESQRNFSSSYLLCSCQIGFHCFQNEFLRFKM